MPTTGSLGGDSTSWTTASALHVLLRNIAHADRGLLDFTGER
jgi:hypothetical protein